MENLRNRVNVNLVNDQTKAKKLIALHTFKHLKIINPELVMIHRLRAKIHQNKPIYTGFSILELSKVHMYRFHYDVMLAKYGLNCRLLFTDTDSILLQHTDKRPVRRHDRIFGTSRYQLISQRPPAVYFTERKSVR